MATYGVRVNLRTTPKIAEQLGNLNAAWAAVEFRLFGIFWVLSGTPLPLARAIFHAQRTTRARIDLVLAVAPIVLRKRRGDGPLSELKKLKRELGRIGMIAGKRNKYVHDPWAARTPDGRRIVQFRLTTSSDIATEYERINASQIARFVDRVETRREALYRIYSRLRPKTPALLERLGRPQSLSLALAAADTHPRRKKAKPARLLRPSQA